MNFGYYYMMSLFSNKDILVSELELWKRFSNNLTGQQDREIFNKLLSDYQSYIDVVLSNDTNESFPSEHLIIALIISQQKKMISWLIYKLSEHNQTYWSEWSISLLLLGCSGWNYGDILRMVGGLLSCCQNQKTRLLFAIFRYCRNRHNILWKILN